MAVAVSRVAGPMSAWLGFSGSRLLQDSANAPMAADDPCRPRHGHASSGGRHGSRPLPVCRATRRRNSVGTVWRAAVASTVVAAGHVRAAAGAARGPQCPEIPHARQARRTGDRANRPRKAREVGKRLHISEGTIKVHLHHIFQKLSIRNRTALANIGRMRPQSPRPQNR